MKQVQKFCTRQEAVHDTDGYELTKALIKIWNKIIVKLYLSTRLYADVRTRIVPVVVKQGMFKGHKKKVFRPLEYA